MSIHVFSLLKKKKKKKKKKEEGVSKFHIFKPKI